MAEVVNVNQASQFQPGKTEYACGFFAVAICASMAPPGQSPTRSPEQIIADAERWYTYYNGPNTEANQSGMTLDQLYALLHHAGLHYQGLPAHIDVIRDWVAAGYPVIVAVNEICIHDLDMADGIPYPWKPDGNHMCVVTGLDGTNVLVRDPANIEPPNTLRPGPRRYDAAKLASGLTSATVVVPPWLPRPPSSSPPLASPPRRGMSEETIPQGWTDDGTTLIAPNGIPVIRGFRTHILSTHWENENWPLEAEHSLSQLEMSNPGLGSGTQQVFRKGALEWNEKIGVIEMWVGQELLMLREKHSLSITPQLQNDLVTLTNALQPMCSAYHALQNLLKGQ